MAVLEIDFTENLSVRKNMKLLNCGTWDSVSSKAIPFPTYETFYSCKNIHLVKPNSSYLFNEPYLKLQASVILTVRSHLIRLKASFSLHQTQARIVSNQSHSNHSWASRQHIAIYSHDLCRLFARFPASYLCDNLYLVHKCPVSGKRYQVGNHVTAKEEFLSGGAGFFE